MKTRVAIIGAVLFALVIVGASLSAGEAKKEKADTTAVNPKTTTQDSTSTEQAKVEPGLIAYYFHGTRRCVTCKKLEAYTQEAIESGFAEQLKSGILQFRPVNIDEEGNGHFVNDYQLYTKSVILSNRKDGKEVSWKNLDKIWELVRGDKEAYVKYIQDEVKLALEEG